MFKIGLKDHDVPNLNKQDSSSEGIAVNFIAMLYTDLCQPSYLILLQTIKMTLPAN